MVLIPLEARHMLTKLTADLCMPPPVYRQTTDLCGLTMVLVTIYLKHPHVTPIVKTFTSEYEATLIIAKDLASRMALRFIEAYYAGDARVTNYFNAHIISNTKKAWQTVAERLANQLDMARDAIRQLHDKLYQARLDFRNLSDNMQHSRMFETLRNNAHLRELGDENTKQRCQIIMLENRIHYLENINAMICIAHLNLLQPSITEEAPYFTNSVQGANHGNEGWNGPPFPSLRANLTEM